MNDYDDDKVFDKFSKTAKWIAIFGMTCALTGFATIAVVLILALTRCS